MSRFGPLNSCALAPRTVEKVSHWAGPLAHFFFLDDSYCLLPEAGELHFTLHFLHLVVFMRVFFQKLQYRPELKLSALVNQT